MALSSLKVRKAVENEKYTIKHVELFLKMGIWSGERQLDYNFCF